MLRNPTIKPTPDRTPTKTRQTPSTVVRFAHRVTDAYRDQLARDNYALLTAQFTALDRRTNDITRRPNRNDPLEQLWRLPARRPSAP